MNLGHARRSVVVLAAAALGAGTLPLVVSTPALAVTATDVEIVADGLRNPRGIAFAPDGTLYVAESGMGGDGPCVGSEEQGGEICYGATGRVTAIDPDGTATVLTDNLPSLAGEGGEAIGPSDVAVAPDGSLRLVIGLGADEATRAELGEEGESFGRLVTIDPADGGATFGADLAAYDYENDPVPGSNPETGEPAPPDSNPYGVHAVEGRTFVVDAGGNDMLSVDDDGEISLEAVFPTRQEEAPPFIGAPPGTKIPMESVPTSITQNDAGDLLVGELTGFPFPVGKANVYTVDTGDDPSEAAQVELTGATNIADVAVRDGDTFVLEFAHNSLLADEPFGALLRFRPDGTRQVLLQDRLFFPGGMAVSPIDGSIYITNQGISAEDGEVLRIDPSLAGDPAIQEACPPDDTAGPSFGDIEASVHEEAIACVAWFGVVNGVDEDEFAPLGTLSRAQAAGVVAKMIDASEKALPETTTDAFSDDNGSTHERNINRLAAAGLVNGRSSTEYAPEGLVQRDQIAALLVRAVEYVTGDALADAPNAFDDDNDSVHEDAIDRAAAAGWISGTRARTFEPSASVRRDQAASMLARVLSSLVDAGEVNRPPSI